MSNSIWPRSLTSASCDSSPRSTAWLSCSPHQVDASACTSGRLRRAWHCSRRPGDREGGAGQRQLALVERVAGHEDRAARRRPSRPRAAPSRMASARASMSVGHDLAEQVGLVGEVGEHRARGHAGGRGDVADGGAFVALLAEQAAGGGEDLGAGLLLGEGAAGGARAGASAATWIGEMCFIRLLSMSPVGGGRRIGLGEGWRPVTPAMNMFN